MNTPPRRITRLENLERQIKDPKSPRMKALVEALESEGIDALPPRPTDWAGVLFLDFDGVLNTVDWCRERAQGLGPGEFITDLQPGAVRELNRILTTCRLGIVVTSSWRLSPRNDLPAILERNGVDRARARYLGVTPELSRLVSTETGLVASVPRGHEIRGWLDANGYTGPFAALDDDSGMEAIAGHHFKTDARIGLTRQIADAVIAYFEAAQRSQRQPTSSTGFGLNQNPEGQDNTGSTQDRPVTRLENLEAAIRDPQTPRMKALVEALRETERATEQPE